MPNFLKYALLTGVGLTVIMVMLQWLMLTHCRKFEIGKYHLHLTITDDPIGWQDWPVKYNLGISNNSFEKEFEFEFWNILKVKEDWN